MDMLFDGKGTSSKKKVRPCFFALAEIPSEWRM